ncbi:hypothetical protein INR49_003152 [Caranx melampygus]|nr:hypothetical protein INR49_003152 [Caranx melampygus]
MVNGTTTSNAKLPGTSTNQTDATDDQGTTRKKVVKVVRSVVRKVMPTEEVETTAPTQPADKTQEAAKPAAEPVKAAPAPAAVSKSKAPMMPGFLFKHDVIKTEEKDDMSRGLKNLMIRGRTRELRPRVHKEERAERVELEKANETIVEKVEQPETKEKPKEERPATKPQEVHQKLTNSTSVYRGSNLLWFLSPNQRGFNPASSSSFFQPINPSTHNARESSPSYPWSSVSPSRSHSHSTTYCQSTRGGAAQSHRGGSETAHEDLRDKQQKKLEPAVSVSSSVQAPVSPVAPQPQGPVQQVKTEEQIAAEQAWYGSEKVWLVHKDGFSLATVVKTEAGTLPEGKVKIKLEHDGTVLDVDEDDIEKANPPSYDRSEDLASLLYLNESSVMNCLRQRYGGNLIHTYAGPNMVVINPLSTPSMYSEKVMHMFKGCRREDSAPHIYSVAQSAYRNLLTTRQDQSIVLLGKSGSGKTTNCQHLLQYLVSIAGSTGKIFSAEKWQAVYTILEAFGNSSTAMNTNASHFSHVVSLDFDQAGQVASASIQTMLLDKLRVSRRPEGESTFNIFYYMMAGADSTLRTELHFNHLAENSAFGIVPQLKPEDKQRAAQQFTKLQAAMKVLGISSEEQKALWLILGSIYHLGAAGATKVHHVSVLPTVPSCPSPHYSNINNNTNLLR